MKNWLKIIPLSIALGFLVKIWVFEVYTIPTDSMLPTLKVGQKVWLNKLPFQNYKLGDVVAFERNGEKFVKRITGMANGIVPNLGFTIPQKGQTLEFSAENFAFYRPLIQSEGVQAGEIVGKIFINNSESSHYKFTQNYYFIEGDNPSVSEDSRQFGLIGEKQILGKCFFK
jgi:signal peptidase I